MGQVCFSWQSKEAAGLGICMDRFAEMRQRRNRKIRTNRHGNLFGHSNI